MEAIGSVVYPVAVTIPPDGILFIRRNDHFA
jgi:hypothetical protein